MLSEDQVRHFHEEGYLFLPETFTDTEVAILKSEAEDDLPPAAAGGLAREIRRAAYRIRRASVQRGAWPARAVIRV